ncbi:MAG: Holliday junction branch migration protein RuvA [Alphaproteobacteria bacterium]|nr:Holliday junction branch migration protein RuvA [Alphaproteobacteria bacterium]
MIAMLAGRVDQVGPDSVVLDVNGVGYLVFCSARSLAEVPARGEPLRLYIETHVREDHIHLYGFLDEIERAWFRLLLGVQGVGARIAMAILGALAPAELATAIVAQDKASITRADGVGPKLASRILIELKDKAAVLAPAAAIASVTEGATADAVSALVNLGYPRGDAYGAVAEAARRLGPSARLDTLIKVGLRELGR